MDCIRLTLDLAAMGAGKLSLEGCRRAAVHLAGCEDCQRLIAFFVTSWEHEHEIPPPPTVIARWRAVVLHINASMVPLVRGNYERNTRTELALLETAARANWSLGVQEHTLHEWLEEVNRRAQAVGGFGPEFGG